LKPDSGHATRRPHFAQWGHTLAQPKIGLLILIFFLATFAFSCFESTLPLLVSDNFNLGIAVDETKPAATVISLFVFCGIIGAFIQGGAIGRLVKNVRRTQIDFTEPVPDRRQPDPPAVHQG